MIIELSDKKQLKKIENKIAKTKNLEILVNNAGYNRTSFFDRDKIDEQEKIFTSQGIATIRLSHAAIQIMKSNRLHEKQ